MAYGVIQEELEFLVFSNLEVDVAQDFGTSLVRDNQRTRHFTEENVVLAAVALVSRTDEERLAIVFKFGEHIEIVRNHVFWSFNHELSMIQFI